MVQASENVETGSKGRRTAMTWIAGVVGGLAAVFAAFSVVAGLLGVADRLEHRVHDVGTGLLLGLIGVGMLAQVRRPERNVAGLQQLGLVILASVAASVIALDASPFIAVPVLAAGAIMWLHPSRSDLFRGGRPAWIPAAVTVLASVPLAVYALEEIAIQRMGGTGPHWEEYHWSGMGTLALAIPLTGLVGALRARGWRVPAWSSGVAGLVLGLFSVVHPEGASSLGTMWGWIAVAGSIVYLSAMEWKGRRGGG